MPAPGGWRRHARRAARALGLEGPALAARRRFLPPHVRRDIRDHEQLIAVLERELAPDACCLDAGAHAGSVLQEIVRICPDGSHTAWEPLPRFAAALRSRFPGVDVRQSALDQDTGHKPFFDVVAEPGWSGLHARATPGGSPTQTIDVRVERLDDVTLPCPPAFVKIDVEGAEAAVLRGAVMTLRRHRPLIAFEHGSGSADTASSGPSEVFTLLTDLGYRIGGLDGDGPYDLEAFAALFGSGERVNFLARPA